MEPKRQPAHFGVMVTDFSLLLEAEDTGRRETASRTGIFFRQRNEKSDLPTETVGNGL